MQLSIIIPIYNEIKYIDSLLSSLLAEDGIQKEILLVDGGSTDGTLNKIEEYQKLHSNIILVTNERKFVSYGFNKAFPLSKGKYVTLMGAHAQYPTNFFNAGISYLENKECDAVGGPLLQVGKTTTGKAIAYAMSTKFGVGGTEFRTETKKMYVDSVAFAIYKREIFENIGLLDEELIRNQDDELHYRINAAGYRILMIPEMQCTYYVRDSFKKLFKQYFEYGLYKPLVFKKVKSGIRLRHIIPSSFVGYLVLGLLSLLLYPHFIFIIPLILYFLLASSFAFKSQYFFKAITAFLVLHLSYGSGFILGLPKYFK